jgi:hypothetical protein
MLAKDLRARRGAGGQACHRGMRSSEKEKRDEGENFEEILDWRFAAGRYSGCGLFNRLVLFGVQGRGRPCATSQAVSHCAPASQAVSSRAPASRLSAPRTLAKGVRALAAAKTRQKATRTISGPPPYGDRPKMVLFPCFPNSPNSREFRHANSPI